MPPARGLGDTTYRMVGDEIGGLNKMAFYFEKMARVLRGEDAAYILPVESVLRDEMEKELSKQTELPKEVRSQIAWTMLLYLYVADKEGGKCISKQLCSVSGAPPTTALRHIQLLAEDGLVHREDPQDDQRVTAYSITQLAREIVEGWARRRSRKLSDLLDLVNEQ